VKHRNYIKNRVLTGLMMAVMTLGFALPAKADQFDDQINNLQAQINQQKAQLGELRAQSNTLANKLAEINAQVGAITNQMALTAAQLQQVNANIEQLNQQMAKQKEFLGENIKAMYMQSTTTPLEVLVSSENLSDFFNKQEYLEKVKAKIQDTLSSLLVTKQDLDKQQQNLATLTAQQKTQHQALLTQQEEQETLLAQTQGQESAYQAMVAQTNQQLQGVIAARAEAIRRAGIKFSSSGCGGYPAVWCNAAQDSMVDDWAFYNRECVSYVAWKRWAVGAKPQPNYWGNAADWFRFVNSYTPHAGDIVVWKAYANPYIGWAGHVAYVESVNGSNVTLSQFNFDVGTGPGRFSVITLSVGDPIMRGVGYIR
jgi:peptidoglycan hydrolase CwlO-like protein